MKQKITYQVKSDWFKVALFFIILLAVAAISFGLAFGLPVIDELLACDTDNNPELLTSVKEDDGEPEVLNIGTAAQAQANNAANGNVNNEDGDAVSSFNMQYYGNYYEYKTTTSDNTYSLPTIDTTKSTTKGLGGHTPTNAEASASDFSTNHVINIALGTGKDKNTDRPIAYKDAALTKFYKGKKINLSGETAVENLSVFRISGENPDYNISEVWVLKDGKDPSSTTKDDWTVYTYTSGMKIKISTSEDAGYDEQTETITIKPDDNVRLIYNETASTDINTQGTLYDYDVTDGQVYSDQTCTSKVSTKNFNVSDYGGKYYTKFRDGDTAAKYKGINSTVTKDNEGFAFSTNQGSTGDNNQLSKFTHDDGSGTSLAYNKASGAYGGLSFGLVNKTGLTLKSGSGYVEDAVVPTATVYMPDLFTKDTTSSNPKNLGKYWKNGIGVFETKGFGRTLKWVMSDDGTKMSSNLSLFTNNRIERGQPEETPLWSNMCWAADNLWHVKVDASGNEYWKYHDQPIGTRNNNNNISFSNLKNGAAWRAACADESPVAGSDLEKYLHNGYFGLTSQVDFSLTNDYVGPLKFLFYGDDDMWLYLTKVKTDANGNETEDLDNAQLICDIGGIHSSKGELVDLWNYLPTSNYGGKYRLRAYYLERGQSGSVFYTNYFLPSTTAFNYPSKTYDANTANGAGGSEVKVGDVITYDINYMNSTDSAVNLTITDTMSKGLEIDGKAVVDGVEIDTTSVVKNPDGSTTYTWVVTGVAAQTADMLIVKGKVTSDATAQGKVANSATVSNDSSKTLGPLENPTPVKGVDVVDKGSAAAADFADDGLAAEIGDVVNYKVDSGIISDAISATEKSVVFSDVIQKGLTLGEYDSTSSTWDAGLVVKYKVNGGSEQTLASGKYNTTDSTINPGDKGDGTKSFIVNVNQALEANTEIWIEFKCTINDDAETEVINTGNVAVDNHGNADTNTVKNPLPAKSVDVKQSGTKTYEDNGKAIAVGDVVSYKVESGNISKTLPAADNNVLFTDSIQTGLTYGYKSGVTWLSSLKVWSKAGSAAAVELTKDTDYEVSGITPGTEGTGSTTTLTVNVKCAIAANTLIWIEFGCTVNAEAQTLNKVTNESTITILNYGSATPAEVENPVPVKAVDVVGKHDETGAFADDGKTVEVEDVVTYKVSSGLIKDSLTYAEPTSTIEFSDQILQGLTLGRQVKVDDSIVWKTNLTVKYSVDGGDVKTLESGYAEDSSLIKPGDPGNNDGSKIYKVNINTNIAAKTLMWIEFDCTVNTDAPSTTDKKVVDTGHVVVLNHGEANTNTTTNPLYEPTPVEKKIPVTKNLSKQNECADPTGEIEWTFTLSAVEVLERVGGSVPMPADKTLKIKTTGLTAVTSAFGEIKYTRSGVYHYQLKETATSTQDWYSDPNTYELYVKVTEDTTKTPGELAVAGLYSDSACTTAYDPTKGVQFSNVYMPPSKQYSPNSSVKSQETLVEMDDTIIYRLYWANWDKDKHNVTLRDIPLAGLTFVSATGTYTSTLPKGRGDGKNYVQWEIGEQVPGANGFVDVTFKVNDDVTIKDGVTNTAKISLDDTPPEINSVETANGWRNLEQLHNPYYAETVLPFKITKEANTGGKCDVPSGVTFNFSLDITPKDGYVDPTTGSASCTTSDTSGKKTVEMELDFGTFKFTKAGSYTATITETKPTDTHWAAQTLTQTVTITVTEFKGVLSVETGPPLANVKFVNVFTPDPVNVPLSVTKKITTATGYTVPAGKTFTFTAKSYDHAKPEPILETKTAYITTKAGQTDYEVKFEGGFSYSSVGTYKIDITEDQPSVEDPDWKFDKTTNTVTVTVTDNNKGKLLATTVPDDPQAKIIFTNNYAPGAVSVPIKVTKKTTAAEGTGGVPVGKTFNFVATEEHAGGTKQEHKASITTIEGKDTYTVDLSSFSFSFEGEYIVKISEIKPSEFDGWEYDTELLREVKVAVKTEPGGALSYTTVPADPTTIVYTNNYNPNPAVVPLTVKKIIETTVGTIPAGKTFDFVATCNGQTLNAFITTELDKAEYAVTFDGEFSFAAVGDYTIKITETTKTSAGWECDAVSKEVKVHVANSATSASLIATTDPDDPATKIVFTNKYDPVPAPANYSLHKVVNVLEGELPIGKEFSFAFAVVPDSGVTPTSGVASVVTKKGCTVYDIALGDFSFTQPGNYKFTVTETTKSEEWWVSDPEPERKFDVEVVADVDGHLYATADPDPGTLTYINTYQPPVKRYSDSSLVENEDTLVDVGDEIEYTLRWSNNLRDEAGATVLLKDTLSCGLSYVAGSADVEPTSVVRDAASGTTVVTWDLGVKEPDTTGTITYKAVVNEDIHKLEKRLVNNNYYLRLDHKPEQYVDSLSNPVPPEPNAPEGEQVSAAQSGDSALFVLIIFCCIVTLSSLILVVRKQLRDS